LGCTVTRVLARFAEVDLEVDLEADFAEAAFDVAGLLELEAFARALGLLGEVGAVGIWSGLLVVSRRLRGGGLFIGAGRWLQQPNTCLYPGFETSLQRHPSTPRNPVVKAALPG
jgi:hypothetical protein